MGDFIELQEVDSTLIHHFVTENNLAGLTEIVLQKQSDIDKCNEAHQTALHLACDMGNIKAVDFLISQGANIHAKDHNEFTPFIFSCYSGNLNCAQRFIGKLTNIDQPDKNGWSALMWSVYKGNTDVVNFLLENGANVNISVVYNVTCLLWAAGRGFSEIAHLLCNKGARVDHVDRYGNTAMIWASRRGFTHIVHCLLEYHADPNIIGANGCSSLIMAVKGKYEECAAMLLNNNKVHVNQADKDGRTALSFAAKIGSVNMINLLLQRGAYLNLADSNGDTPLIKAVKHGHLEAVKVLLSHFADVDVKGKDKKTALHIACENGKIGIIRELLKCDCKIECFNSNKETPLLRAVIDGNVKVAKILLVNGADVSVKDKNDNTCVHIAIRSQNIQLAEVILQNPKHARYLYQENKFGETPYDIDQCSNKKILSQLFGSKGFSTAAMSSDPALDITSCSLAEMLSEPMLEPPLCIGLYAKWDSNVMYILNKIKNQVELFSSPSPSSTYSMFWLTFGGIFYFAVVFAVFTAFMVDNSQKIITGVLAFSITMVISSFVLFCLYLGVRLKKWPWTRSASKRIHQLEDYFRLLFHICFIKQKSTSAGKVRYIFAECMNISSFKENDMMSGITSELLRSTERNVGRVAFRIARALHQHTTPRSNASTRFRKICCIPSFIVLLLWMFGFSVLAMLIISMYGPNPLMDVESEECFSCLVAIYVISSILGLTMIIAAPFLWNVFSSLLFSMKKVHSKLVNELNQNRAEITRLNRALSVIDAIKKTKTRICILVNALEVSDQSQLHQLVHAIHAVYSAQPIITVMCIDYQLVTSALQQSQYSFVDNGDFKGSTFIHHVVQLPLFLPDKKRRKRFLDDVELIESDSEVDELATNSKKKYPKHFDVTKWLVAHDCFHPANPLLLKRVASIISLTARLLRSAGRDFSWNALSAWIVLTELWAYSTTCMIVWISKKNPSPSKTLKSLYFEIRNLISNNHAMDLHDTFWLQQFISNKSCTITIADVIEFHNFTINLDPCLEDITPTFSETWTTHSNSRRPSVSQVSSTSCDEAPLWDWTVEDVWRRLKSIQGLDTSNFQLYQSFVYKNNFHGLALFLCDVDELKNELKTSFGDWCLIKKFILETKNSSTKSNHLLIGSALSNSKKSSDPNVGFLPDEMLSDDNPMPILAERVAYNKNFKEYLKLQPEISEVTLSSANHHTAVLEQLDNRPLLHEVDINAN